MCLFVEQNHPTLLAPRQDAIPRDLEPTHVARRDLLARGEGEDLLFDLPQVHAVCPEDSAGDREELAGATAR